MYLLLLILIFILIGYLLAESRVGKKIDGVAEEVSTSSRKWMVRTSDRMRSMVGIKSAYERFDAWVNTFGEGLLPSDFKTWYTKLSQDDARSFSNAFARHLKSLGLRLNKLVDGGIDQDPMLRQVFVETIVIYSQEFRKVKQAKKEVEEDSDAADKNGEEKKMAEKRSSRRKNQSNDEGDVFESATPA